MADVSTRYLENRTALVTGSTSGIGAGIAKCLASRGCHIILNGFGEESVIKALQEEITSKYNTTAEYMAADLSSVAEIEQMYEKIKQLYPRGVDILVNNAGLGSGSPVEQFPPEKWDAQIAVMLSAPFHLIRLMLPDMKRNGWGRIINTASVCSIMGLSNRSAYVSAKHGVVGLTKTVALEAAATGVTCNAISPGFVDTPLIQVGLQAYADRENVDIAEAKAKFFAKYHPTNQPVAIEHIAEMCSFLCSEAASQMTGANVIMDGGASIGLMSV